MLRKTSVAGYFYPEKSGEILDFIKKYELKTQKSDACAVIVPHAGYVYSGATAVKTLSQIKIPDTVILMGPNHTGSGKRVSVYPEGAWETPLGEMKTDDSIIEKLCSNDIFDRDASAHEREHSLEVILPIIRYFNPSAKIVCITMKYTTLEVINSVYKAIIEAVDGRNVLIVVSSDLNHFENVSITDKKDALVIESIKNLDEITLYNKILDYNITMCGIVPACVGILYAKHCGVKEAQLVEHTHSGVVSGDNDRVVGYAGIIFNKKD